tara:strand:+ start:269 stop:1156 length:888 start_codon:yes stop_codon:yes gene_type:complete
MIRILLVANPKSGVNNNNNILKLTINEFEKRNIEFTLINTEYSGHAINLVKNFNFNEYSSVCAVGGDGTLNEVLNGMLGRDDQKKVPIGLVPGGTGNSFMKTLDLLEPLEAIMKIINNKPRSIDIMRASGYDGVYYSLNLVGWGMATDISIVAEKLRFIGGQRYNIASVIEIIINKKRPAKLIIDGVESANDYCFIIACNTKYIGKGMKMAPEAVIDDGLMDLIVVKKNSRSTLLSVFPKLFNGEHISHPACEYIKCRKFSIEPEQNDPLNIDGEIIGYAPVDVELIENGIELLV